MMERTLSEALAEVRSGTERDFLGEHVIGDDVNEPPTDAVVKGLHVTGQSQVYGATRLVFENCGWDGTPDVMEHGLLRMLGGDRWTVRGCTFAGGIVAAQLGIGLGHGTGFDRVPTEWTVAGCDFWDLAGQWGNDGKPRYPQGHHLYNLTDPAWSQDGRITDCQFSGCEYGASVKIGGTGNSPRTEGSRGVLVEDCVIGARPGLDGRATAVLGQGEQTDFMVRDCMLHAGVAPWVQAADNSRVRMIDTDTPDGVVCYTTWRALLVIPQSDKYATPAGVKPRNSKNNGRLSWATTR